MKVKVIDYIVNNYNDWDNNVIGISFDNDRLRLEYYELETENNEFCEHNKKLREEIEQLKSELNDWKQRFNSSEERYKSFALSSVECIQKKEERFKKEQNKVAVEKMKEINILCVEDGSVDVESLENEGLHDGKVIIYRQGANPPFVLKLKTDDGEFKSEQNKVAVEKLEELLKESSVEYHLCDSAGGKYKCSIDAVNDIFIKEQIKELKGEKDE